MTITVPVPSSSPNTSWATSSPTPIRCSPLSQPPLYAPTRTPSPLPRAQSQYDSPQSPPHLFHVPTAGGSQARAIPSTTTRRTSGTTRYAVSVSPLASGSSTRIAPLSPSPGASPTAYSPSTPPSSRRYDPTTTHATPSPPLSRSQPLLGSYPLSLLHSRMSHAHPPHSLTEGFTVRLSAIGRGKVRPSQLKCPEPLVVPFSATYYDLEDPDRGSGASASAGVGAGAGGPGKQTPWVGTVDLENHYFNAYSAQEASSPSLDLSHPIGPSRRPPAYPGYRVAERGQLQILIKTPDQALKVFVLPYDLHHIPIGGRLLVREKSYGQCTAAYGAGSSGSYRERRLSGTPLAGNNNRETREKLRYAVQVQFCCAAVAVAAKKRNSEDDNDDDTVEKAFYLSKSIKLIFTSSLADSSEELRTERTDELVPPLPPSPGDANAFEPVSGSKRRRSLGFSPGSLGQSRGEEWQMVRRKWAASQEKRDREMEMEMDDHPPKQGAPAVGSGSASGSGQSQHDNTLLNPQPTRAPVPDPVLVPLTSPIPKPKSKSESNSNSIEVPELDIPAKDDRPRLGHRGPSLLSVTSPSHIRLGTPRPSSPTSPTISTISTSASQLGTGTTSTTPTSASTSPTPVLSPLPRRSTLGLSSPARPVPITPLSASASASPRALSPALPSVPAVPVVWSPAPQRRARREDVQEERELSERLRRLDVGNNGK